MNIIKYHREHVSAYAKWVLVKFNKTIYQIYLRKDFVKKRTRTTEALDIERKCVALFKKTIVLSDKK